MNILLVMLVGVAGGLAAALQGQFLGIMEDRAGTLPSVFATYFGGGIAIGLLMLAARGQGLAELRGAPWWAYTAGLMGLVIVGSLGVTVSELGLGAGLTLFTAAALIIGAALDATGWFGIGHPFDGRRLIGVGVVILGTWLVVGVD